VTSVLHGQHQVIYFSAHLIVIILRHTCFHVTTCESLCCLHILDAICYSRRICDN